LVDLYKDFLTPVHFLPNKAKIWMRLQMRRLVLSNIAAPYSEKLIMKDCHVARS
jgi:hypothetical protein